MSNRSEVDAVVVGAGFAGLYALHRLRGMGLSVRVIEAGHGVGGTWYWNRYPGARCDVPSLEYSYSFDEDLQREWEWSEVMSTQPEILRYLEHVADRFDLRRDITFDTRVVAATYDERANRWVVTTDGGEAISATWCVMATGCLSAPLEPDLPGLASFAGELVYTNRWPEEGVDLTGRRVGVVGTGSSGVQSIPVIAGQADHLTVFQRTPVYTLPVDNRPIDPEFARRIKERYPEIRKLQRYSQGGIAGFGLQEGTATGLGSMMTPPTRRITEATEEERAEALDNLGFGAVFAWADVRVDPTANELACELYREQVRRLVEDPDVAEGLMPRGYPIGCKRQVIDTGYYATFNRDNVTLVDLRREAIEEVTPDGIRTSSGHHPLDVLVLATGFDAMTGALARIDIRGRDGVALRDKWAAGPRTYLGIQSAGFPNLFTITGPGSPAVLSNMVVSIEQHVDFVADCITHLGGNGYARIEPDPVAEAAWVEHVNEVAAGTMYTHPSCSSWYLGANVPGKPRIFMPYVGGVGTYRLRCEEVVANGYEGFVLS